MKLAVILIALNLALISVDEAQAQSTNAATTAPTTNSPNTATTAPVTTSTAATSNPMTVTSTGSPASQPSSGPSGSPQSASTSTGTSSQTTAGSLTTNSNTTGPIGPETTTMHHNSGNMLTCSALAVMTMATAFFVV